MKTSYINNQPIDLVYLWCDMNDERWNERRKKEVEKWRDTIKLVEEESVARYQSHDELRYSLRSVEMYAPWIRDIFIVVCDYATLPSWLNISNPRLHIVRHSEIIPAEYLPCYNSVTIEHFISRIPDLAEHFLYANDDMFFFDSVTSYFFFDDNGLPKKRVTAETFRPQQGHYATKLNNSFNLIKEQHPELKNEELNTLHLMPHHGIDSYRKSHNLATYERYREAIEKTLGCPFRRSCDIQRVIYLMEEIATYGGSSIIISKTTPDSMCGTGASWRRKLDNALRLRPKLFCLNASHENTPDDFKWLSLVEQMLYPNMSQFEKNLNNS